MQKIILSMFCASGLFATDGSNIPFAMDEKTAVVSQEKENEVLGKDAIAKIRKAYEDGEYDVFLKEMDASYESVKQGGQLNNLASLREANGLDLNWIASLKQLNQEKNEQLVQAVASQDTLFAEKVRSAAATIVTKEQDEALLKLANIHQMLPGSGKNNDENTLIALDLEYEYKTMHLDMDKTSLRDKHYVLRMEQMNKMLLASQSFEDVSLKETVILATQNFDARLSQNWDQVDIQALSRMPTKDRVQDKVVSILQSHQTKLSDLAQKSMDNP